MASDTQIEIKASLQSFRFNEAEIRELIRGPVMRDLVRRAIRVTNQAKRNASQPPPSVPGYGPSVRTGLLRGSITWRPGIDAESAYVDVGTAVEYACVFGAHSSVVTENGIRTIGQIKSGDRVLTQAGDFQTVLAVSSFPAVEKPDLVDLVVPWRQGRSHRLTLTLDHKVLCFRDGRNQWVLAGDLRDGDMLYDRIKISHSKGTGLVKVCEWCDRRHQGQGRRYCSRACRDAAWAAGANPHLGVLRSDATREKLRQKAIARQSGVRMNRQLAAKGHRTSHEREVEQWLQERGVSYECQVGFAGMVVDFFLPETREIIEADGAYWHQNQERDIERDQALLAAAPGVEITHLHFFDKRFSPPLNAEPLPGVRYVACNPGPGSFVDPGTFRPMPVTVLRHWNYAAAPKKPKGSHQAKLYDIAVEGVHSFLANGVVVSNSYVELGTVYMDARPYLRPALEAARSNI